MKLQFWGNGKKDDTEINKHLGIFPFGFEVLHC